MCIVCSCVLYCRRCVGRLHVASTNPFLRKRGSEASTPSLSLPGVSKGLILPHVHLFFFGFSNSLFDSTIQQAQISIQVSPKQTITLSNGKSEEKQATSASEDLFFVSWVASGLPCSFFLVI